MTPRQKFSAVKHLTDRIASDGTASGEAKAGGTPITPSKSSSTTADPMRITPRLPKVPSRFTFMRSQTGKKATDMSGASAGARGKGT